MEKNIDEIMEIMNGMCPDMLSSDTFMDNVNRYCNGEFLKVRELPEEEYKIWMKLHERISTANIGQLIDYLSCNFNPEDKLCYMDCVEGMKNDCTYVTKDQLGERFFYYVNRLPEDMRKLVGENDVVVC